MLSWYCSIHPYIQFLDFLISFNHVPCFSEHISPLEYVLASQITFLSNCIWNLKRRDFPLSFVRRCNQHEHRHPDHHYFKYLLKGMRVFEFGSIFSCLIERKWRKASKKFIDRMGCFLVWLPVGKAAMESGTFEDLQRKMEMLRKMRCFILSTWADSFSRYLTFRHLISITLVWNRNVNYSFSFNIWK